MSDEPARSGFFGSGLWALAAAVAMVGWIAYGNLTEDTDPGRTPYTIRGVASQDEEAALARLLDAAYLTLRSPEFRQNLLRLDARYPAVFANPGDPAADLAKVARIVSVEQPGARYAPATVAVADALGSELAMAGEGGNHGRYSHIVIGRAVLGAFSASDTVARSCAVNVAAHEYSHTISLTPIGYRTAFTDTRVGESRIAGRRDADTPVGSYLIGAVAQCTWLQRQGRIGQQDVPACVEVFGVRGFNWERCRQFAGGEPVTLRPGLAPASPTL